MRAWIAMCALLGACTTDLPSEAMWPDREEPIGGNAPLGYTTNNGEDTVSVVELATMTEIARRPVGISPVDPEAPHHLALDGDEVYIGLSNVGIVVGGGLHGGHGGGLAPSYVERRSRDDLSASGELAVDPNLGDIVRVAPGRIATTHFDLALALATVQSGAPREDGYGALFVIDGAAMTIESRTAICTAPHGLAVTSDGALGIAACYGDDEVAFVDLDAGQVLGRTPVGPDPGTVTNVRYGPYAVAIAPDESFAYVGTLEGMSLRRIDVANRTEDPTGAIVFDGAVFFGAFDPSGARYWVATQLRDSVALIDVATSAITVRHLFTREECVSPHEAVYVPSIDRVIVVCEGDRVGPGRLVALEPDTLAIVGQLDVGVYPDVLRVVEP